MSEADSGMRSAAAEPADATTDPPLLLVKGDATPEQVAALTVVLQAVAAAGAAAAAGEKPRVTPEWSAPSRRLRATHAARPGGWRSSGLPR